MFDDFERALDVRRHLCEPRRSSVGSEDDAWGAPRSSVSTPFGLDDYGRDFRRHRADAPHRSRDATFRQREEQWLSRGQQRDFLPRRGHFRSGPRRGRLITTDSGFPMRSDHARRPPLNPRAYKDERQVVGNWQLFRSEALLSTVEETLSERVLEAETRHISLYTEALPESKLNSSVTPPWPWDKCDESLVDTSESPLYLDAMDIAYHHGECRGYLSFAGIAVAFGSIKASFPRRQVRIVFLRDELKALWQPRRSDIFPDNRNCYDSLMGSDLVDVLSATPYNTFLGVKLRSVDGHPIVPVQTSDVLSTEGWEHLQAFKSLSQEELLCYCQTRSRFGRTVGKVKLLCEHVRKQGGRLITNDSKQFVPLGLLHADILTEDGASTRPPSGDDARQIIDDEPADLKASMSGPSGSLKQDPSLFEYMTANRVMYVFASSNQFIFAADRFTLDM